MYNLPISGHKNIIRCVVVCISLLAAFIFWNLSSGAAADAAKEYGGIVQLRSASQFLSAARVSDILEKRDFEKEDVRYTAWSQAGGVTVENYSLGSRTRFDGALYYFGDNYGVFSLLLDNGCALSEGAAFEVFGTTTGILGEAALINGEVYIVEKLLYGGAADLIYKVRDDDSKAGFDVLNVVCGEEGDFSASALQMNSGVNGDIVIVYADVIRSFTALGRLVIWAAFIAFALIFAGGVGRKSNNRLWKWAVVVGGLLAVLFFCGLFIGSPFFIPNSFIPTRWSEFEFWANTFSRFTDAFRYYFAMKAYAPDIVFRLYAVKALVYALISATLVILAGRILLSIAALKKIC